MRSRRSGCGGSTPVRLVLLVRIHVFPLAGDGSKEVSCKLSSK
jgi:hypothetical protein